MQVDLKKEMKKSYLDYTMSVIVGRALPDVHDGLKPVHRRVIYTMYDGDYRPNGGSSKCMRVVGDVLGHFHPHGDASMYDALARLMQPWSTRYPLVAGQGNFGSPGNLGPAVPRYTECRMAALTLEMVRDIEEDMVDFMDNYDGRNQKPTVPPSRVPNLLMNEAEGIAVGMATRVPPRSLCEIADAAQWYLEHPEASRKELLEAAMQRIKGPNFPTGATILGRRDIEDTHRTGHGSIVQRAVVNVEELYGRTCLMATESPYQVSPDNLLMKIVQLTKDGQLQGIVDIHGETSDRAGTRLVVVSKRNAVPKVVLNNLYKRTQLQDAFPANMLALVDGVPRTLSLDGSIHHWVVHQVNVIRRRTEFRLCKAWKRLHILQGYLAALGALDEVIALIRCSPTVEDARVGLMDLFSVDEVQADVILALQLRRLAALERQKILDECAKLEAEVTDFQDTLAKPERQHAIVSTELAEIVNKWADEHKTAVVPFAGEMLIEDLILEEDMVVTITRGGFAKRTRVDVYRSQHRGGKGVKGAQLHEDDRVEHLFTSSSHDWVLFFTNFGRVYHVKAYEIPEGGHGSKGQHVANLLAFQPEERIAQVLHISSFEDKEYLVLVTKRGFVKKTHLTDYNTNRTGGLIAIKLREDLGGEPDQLVSAVLADDTEDLILVSRDGQSLRFATNNDQLRPMGRSTSGMTGMRFRDDDELLTMDVVRPGADLFVVTEGGYAKRTDLSEYCVQGRDGLRIKVANLVEACRKLVGALITDEESEVLVIMAGGKIVRSRVDEVFKTGRNIQDATFSRADGDDRVVVVTLNADNSGDEEETDSENLSEVDTPSV